METAFGVENHFRGRFTKKIIRHLDKNLSNGYNQGT